MWTSCKYCAMGRDFAPINDTVLLSMEFGRGYRILVKLVQWTKQRTARRLARGYWVFKFIGVTPKCWSDWSVYLRLLRRSKICFYSFPPTTFHSATHHDGNGVKLNKDSTLQAASKPDGTCSLFIFPWRLTTRQHRFQLAASILHLIKHGAV